MSYSATSRSRLGIMAAKLIDFPLTFLEMRVVSTMTLCAYSWIFESSEALEIIGKISRIAAGRLRNRTQNQTIAAFKAADLFGQQRVDASEEKRRAFRGILRLTPNDIVGLRVLFRAVIQEFSFPSRWGVLVVLGGLRQEEGISMVDFENFLARLDSIDVNLRRPRQRTTSRSE